MKKTKTTTKQKILLIMFSIFLTLIMIELGFGKFILLTVQRSHNINIGDNSDQKVYKILALGESTTAGTWNTWPTELEKILNERSRKVKFIVYNEAVPGVNTLYLVSKLKGQIKRYNPDIIITMMGANDLQGLVTFINSKEIETQDSNKISNKNYSSKTTLKQNNLFIKIKNTIIDLLASDERLCEKYTNLGNVYFYEEGRLSKAKQTYEKALNKCNHKAPIYVSLGYMYSLEGYSNEAEKMWYMSIEDDPNHWQAYIELGDMYYINKDFNKSINLYNIALNLTPNNTHHMNKLAYIYYRNEQISLAKDTLTKSINISQDNDRAFELLGKILFREKKYSQATILFEKASENNNNKDLNLISKLYLAEINKNLSELTVDGLTIKFNNSIKERVKFSATRNHYLYIYELSKQSNITYIAMQYPTLSVDIIKNFFSEKDKEKIIFVSNEDNFKQILEKERYDVLFIDTFALNLNKDSIFYEKYGHTTVKGTKLIAENVANIILKELNISTN